MSEHITKSTLEAYAEKLQALAADAKKRGDENAPPYPPGYWYGVEFGLETAIAELKALTPDGDV